MFVVDTSSTGEEMVVFRTAEDWRLTDEAGEAGGVISRVEARRLEKARVKEDIEDDDLASADDDDFGGGFLGAGSL